jgi:hypothetical protein
MGFEIGWRRCKNCLVLVLVPPGASQTAGSCGSASGGGVHDLSDKLYGLFYDEPDLPGQNNWSACLHCMGLFFTAPSPAASVSSVAHPHCPSPLAVSTNGRHAQNNKNYTMPRNEINWFKCINCGVVFYEGVFYGSDSLGRCARGGHHETGSGMYWIPFGPLPHWPPGTPHGGVQPNWHYCKNCKGLFFSDNPAQRGHCPGAIGFGPHDPSESGIYAVARAPNAAVWHKFLYCQQCHALYEPWDPAFPVTPETPGRRCPAPNATDHSPANYSYYTLMRGEYEWRYCGKCQAMWYSGNNPTGKCPKDGMGHNGDVPVQSGNYMIPFALI